MYDCSVYLWWLHFRIIYLYFYTNIVWVEFFLPLQLFTWLGEHSPPPKTQTMCVMLCCRPRCPMNFGEDRAFGGGVLLSCWHWCCHVVLGVAFRPARQIPVYVMPGTSEHHPYTIPPLLASIHCPLPTVHCPVFTVQCPPSGAQCPESCFQRQALAD